MRRFALLLALLLGSCLLPANAHAQSAQIVLVGPQSDDGLHETLTRIHGELIADGFRVQLTSLPSPAVDSELRRVLEASPEAVALVGLFSQQEPPGLELRVMDKDSQTMVARFIGASEATSATPEVLARRAVEVLRATLLQLLVVPRARVQVKTTPADSEPTVEQPRESRVTLGAEVGAYVITSADEIGPAVLPVLRLRLGMDRFFVRAMLTGFGTRPAVQTAVGSASIDQQLAMAEFGSWLSTGALRPFVHLGLGGYHLRVRASAGAPYVSSDDSLWAFATGAGAGLSWQLASELSLVAEANALLSMPYPVVRFVGEEVARTGRPAFGAALTLAGEL